MIAYDLCCQHSQRLYSVIRVCIIMMHLTRLYRVAKAIYGIIISIKFPWCLSLLTEVTGLGKSAVAHMIA